MVQIKLSAAFILAAAAITPVVALPARLTPQIQSVFMSICSMIISDLCHGYP